MYDEYFNTGKMYLYLYFACAIDVLLFFLIEFNLWMKRETIAVYKPGERGAEQTPITTQSLV